MFKVKKKKQNYIFSSSKVACFLSATIKRQDFCLQEVYIANNISRCIALLSRGWRRHNVYYIIIYIWRCITAAGKSAASACFIVVKASNNTITRTLHTWIFNKRFMCSQLQPSETIDQSLCLLFFLSSSYIYGFFFLSFESMPLLLSQ